MLNKIVKKFISFSILFAIACCENNFWIFQEDANNPNLTEAIQFLQEYDREASNMCFRVKTAQWTYSTNITDHNKHKMIEEQALKAKFDKVLWQKAAAFNWTFLPINPIRRQFRMLTLNSKAALDDAKYNEIYHLIAEMKEIYAHIRITPYIAERHHQETAEIYDYIEIEDVQKIMASSTDHFQLLHTWREWHDNVGPPMRNKFMRYINLANEAANLNGFPDAGIEMQSVYETTDFQDELAETFQKILPLYKQLFTYVRSKLYKKYGPDVVRRTGPLPAHILGNIWTQEWSKIYDIVAPFPHLSNKLDVTTDMLRNGLTASQLFKLAEEFYTSLGLKPLPPEFWNESMLEKPISRKVQCTASAWDFCNKKDFRIKQCTEVNMDNLISTFREMAHIEYYLHYAEQPFLYRDGANPGFHEAVANSILLSIFNPTHLERMNLLKSTSSTIRKSFHQDHNNINFLLLMGLKKIAYAPFAYLVDQWRYQIFTQGVAGINADWWNLRLRYQGIVPPVPRNEYHFDAAAKRHIPADIPYIKYYVALLLEFQIFKSMCEAAHHTGPLHSCDIYRSREAGRVLSSVLRVGKARHWKDLIKMLTNGRSDKLSAEPLMEYFQPLYEYLQNFNQNEDVVGWTTSKEDFALYQPLVGKSCIFKSSNLELVFSVIIGLYLSNYYY